MNDAAHHLMTLFSSALEHEAGADRDAYLNLACGGDPALRARVESLLRAHEHGGRFLEAAPAGPPPTSDLPANGPVAQTAAALVGSPVSAGSVVAGRYKLLEEIGEGGMGAVWMAEQTEPVQRRVALKLIKPGMDSRQVVARFEAERQALALMDHPNIAKVLDGGVTGGELGGVSPGRPFFVMELVKGTPITKYCDEKKLSVRERMELFADVCRAVQHAHQKGIIHRDLKPSNVLVAPYDGKPVVKVIDFGIAKATGQKLTEATLFTGFGAVVGTPEYMSPEQAEVNNQDIDTRSDVYSLGVLLYELLTGTTPLTRQRVKEAALLEVLRLIREEEPQRPSTRLSSTDELPSIAAVRGVEPARLSKLVRGELDWIVMKALEKDRNRRYETANGFALDVQRYLADEPVQACPPSAGYRLRKFVRRNRGPVLTAVAVALALLLGAGIATWQAIRATNAEKCAIADQARANKAEERALVEAATSRAINDFLLHDLLDQASPEFQAKRDVSLRSALDRAARRIAGKFAEQPLVEAGVRTTLARAYWSLGAYEEAQMHLERELALRRAHQGPDNRDTLAVVNNLALLAAERERFADAEKSFRELLDRESKLVPPNRPRLLVIENNLARVLNKLDRASEAEAICRAALPTARDLLGPEHPDTLNLDENLAIALDIQNRHAEAEKLYRDILQKRRKAQGDSHPATLNVMHNLAMGMATQERYAEAEVAYRDVLKRRRQVLGETHRDTLASQFELANTLHKLSRREEAEKAYREVIEKGRSAVDIESRWFVDCLGNLGITLVELGRAADGEPLLEEALTIRMRVKGPDDPATLDSVMHLAHSIAAQGRLAEAEKMHGEAIARRERVQGREHHKTLLHMLEQINVVESQNRLEEAEKMLRELVEVRRRVSGEGNSHTLNARENLAVLLFKREQQDDGEEMLRDVLARRKKTLRANHPDLLKTLNNMTVLLVKRKRFAQAEDLARERLTLQRELLGPKHAQTLAQMVVLVEICGMRGDALKREAKNAEAAKAYERGLSVAVTLQELAPDHPLAGRLRDQLEARRASLNKAVKGKKP